MEMGMDERGYIYPFSECGSANMRFRTVVRADRKDGWALRTTFWCSSTFCN
jgi:hypothetical protein